jgi:hypothetical protein
LTSNIVCGGAAEADAIFTGIVTAVFGGKEDEWRDYKIAPQ